MHVRSLRSGHYIQQILLQYLVLVQKLLAQHARFLEYASALRFELDENRSAQSNFDTMYSVVTGLLDTVGSTRSARLR